jgi:hypothetical protein
MSALEAELFGDERMRFSCRTVPNGFLALKFLIKKKLVQLVCLVTFKVVTEMERREI